MKAALIECLMINEAAPAKELARLYHERWHVEAVFDGMKTHLLHAPPHIAPLTLTL